MLSWHYQLQASWLKVENKPSDFSWDMFDITDIKDDLASGIYKNIMERIVDHPGCKKKTREGTRGSMKLPRDSVK